MHLPKWPPHYYNIKRGNNKIPMAAAWRGRRRLLFLVLGSSLIQIDSALPCQTIGFFAVVIHSVSPSWNMVSHCARRQRRMCLIQCHDLIGHHWCRHLAIYLVDHQKKKTTLKTVYNCCAMKKNPLKQKSITSFFFVDKWNHLWCLNFMYIWMNDEPLSFIYI